MLNRKNDSGRSIVEMLGVLAIMGVITVMGISGYSQAVGKINRNSTVEAVTKIAQEVRGLFAGRGDYNETEGTAAEYDIGKELLAKMKYKLTSPYGKDFEIKSFGSASSNPGFSVSFCGVPAEDCLYFTTMSWTDVMNAAGTDPSTNAYAGATAPATDVAGCGEAGSLNCITVYYK